MHRLRLLRTVVRILLGTGLLVGLGATAASLVGCGSETETNTIADSTMVDLLVELHLANARIEITDRPLPVPRDSILRSYGVDSTAFSEAISYYAHNPDEYSRVYGRVLDRLSAERLPVDEQSDPDVTAPPADTMAPQVP